MIYVEILKQESSQDEDTFRDNVQERINQVTNYNPNNLKDITWEYDYNSYYPYICIITFYKEEN